MSRELTVDPDELAQFIRQVDGDNRMGAGALAERIVEWFGSRVDPAEPLVTGWLLDNIEAKVAGLDPDSESCVSNGDVLDLVKAVRTFQVRLLLNNPKPAQE